MTIMMMRKEMKRQKTLWSETSFKDWKTSDDSICEPGLMKQNCQSPSRAGVLKVSHTLSSHGSIIPKVTLALQSPSIVICGFR